VIWLARLAGLRRVKLLANRFVPGTRCWILIETSTGRRLSGPSSAASYVGDVAGLGPVGGSTSCYSP
jgi:hypothetical protein